ncbi:MAG TPA: hypothetical protein VHY37_09590, partial [Tepidisphaeraceae bacterium]|nr:hypothetical protein [Tepidisphaeraceae bacterium]
MYKFIRKYQKMFLAIFGVGLMVIFIIPSAFKGGGGYGNRIVAYIGDKPVYATESLQSEAEWKMLRSMRDFNSQGQPIPVAAAYLGNSLFGEIDDKPELFLMLQKEATQQGVTVSPQMVVDLAGTEQSEEGQERRAAFHSLLLVAGLRDQLASAVQFTEPMETHRLAQEAQKARLSLVTFKADQFKPAIPTPTMDQLRKMYDQYKNTIPVAPDAAPNNPFQSASSANPDDPLGFGYEQPRRVKLQYLEITRQSLLGSVARTKSDYDWEFAARKYYYSHEDQYPSTNPATQPTTQPYADVRQDILDKLRNPDADALQEKVRTAIQDKLNANWSRYAATTEPASQAFGPTSRAATNPQGKFAYFQQIAADIKKQFGIEPVVNEVTDYESAAELAGEPNIGQATLNDTSFAEYAVGSDDSSAAGKNLHVFQPSQWLSDAGNDSFIFRLTAVAPATPSPFDAVQSTVASDWVTQKSYDKALAAAKDLAKQADHKMLQIEAMRT